MKKKKRAEKEERREEEEKKITQLVTFGAKRKREFFPAAPKCAFF